MSQLQEAALIEQRYNLPAPPAPLVGREQEVEELTDLLRREGVRLVTLTGPGGTGKTRLALEVAHRMLSHFADGVFFISLAPLQDPELVPATIADELDVQERGDEPILQTLKDVLAQRELLLVLDNFEHLMDTALAVSELLSAAPRLHVLVTSREWLRLRGERHYPVNPLTVPTTERVGEGLILEEARAYAAVELFRQRAEAAVPSFKLTGENVGAVAGICARLDGLPLAIELAAARLPLFGTPEALLNRLRRGFKLLKSGARDLPQRQQTLQAAIGWSYHLLERDEQKLLRRLAVFVAGHTLEAAEAVCNAEGDLGIDVLDGIEALLDKSLLRREEGVDGEPRFGMLQTIHDFARERLEASGEAEAMRRRHVHYFLELTEEAEPLLLGPKQAQWLQHLEREHDNLRGVLTWSQETAHWETMARQAAALAWYWYTRGHASEGRSWLESALARTQEDADMALRARLLHGVGRLCWLQGDYDRARTYSEESLEIARRCDDETQSFWALGTLGGVAESQGNYISAQEYHARSLVIAEREDHRPAIARALGNLGNVAAYRGDYATAQSYYARSLAVAEETGDKQAASWAFSNLGVIVSEQGDYASAHAYHEQCLALAEELGEKQIIAFTLSNLGTDATRQGNYPLALSHYWQALTISEAIGEKRLTAYTLCNIGRVKQRQGDSIAARSFLERSMSVAKELGDRLTLGFVLNSFGRVAHSQSDYASAESYYKRSLAIAQEISDRWMIGVTLSDVAVLAAEKKVGDCAVRLWAAAQRLREETGAAIPPADQDRYQNSLAAAHQQLGERDFVAALAVGRAMSLQEAVAEAMEFPSDDDKMAKPRSGKATPAHPAGLTPRESDVLQLVAQGMTDAEVAEALVISPRTVNAHLTSIYSKLDVHSRTEATRLALENGWL